MRVSKKGRAFTGIVFVVLTAVSVVVHSQSSRLGTEAMVDEWMTDLSNWGRFCSED